MTEFDPQRIQESFFSRYWRWELCAEDGCAETCGEELAKRLPHIDGASWPQRFALGGVYVGGRPVSFDSPFSPPCRLEYYEPKFDPQRAADFYPRFSPSWILLDHSDIGVAFKPAGLPTTAPRDQQQFYSQRYLEQHYAAPVHTPSRLDTAVAGLLIFSRSARGNRWCQKAQDRRLVRKLYLCEVSGEPRTGETSVTSPLGRDERHPVLRRVVASGGEDAWTRITHLRALQSPGRTLLQAEPLTGRTHQIRVHCASEGWPIVGDPLYGGEEAPELRLVSYALGFFHPFLQRQIWIQLPLALRPAWIQDAEGDTGPIRLALDSLHESDLR